ELATRPRDAEVARGGATAVVAPHQDDARIVEALDDLHRAIRRSVVDHDDLVILPRLREDGAEGVGDVALPVVHRDDDAEGEGIRIHVWLRPRAVRAEALSAAVQRNAGPVA